MWHPEEGLVHTWLDGAASANEAREIEAHIESCDSCRALVIEARGLIAGASRIVGSLDGVPGDVIPNASASGSSSVSGSASAGVIKHFRLHHPNRDGLEL